MLVMKWWMIYGAVGLVALLLCAGITPLCRHLAWRWGFLDKPLGEGHKKHDSATPLLGGLAMLVSWLITLMGGLAVGLLGRQHLPPEVYDLFAGLGNVWQLLLVISVGATALAVMGLIDDRKAMGPGLKFILQILICSVVALYPRVRITLFIGSPLLTWGITLFWLLFIINSFNFFDNMDGLASGIAMIAAFLFAVVAGLRGQHFVAALAMATAGVAAGFYLHNRAPASIFMGDSGSHLLGFLLAVLGTLTLFYKESETPTTAAFLIPLMILALPIFDTFAVVYIRLREGRPIYTGDHSHISHRFLKLGVSRKTAVLLVHLLSLALGLGAVSLLWLGMPGVIIILTQSLAILALVTILHGIERETPVTPSVAAQKREHSSNLPKEI